MRSARCLEDGFELSSGECRLRAWVLAPVAPKIVMKEYTIWPAPTKEDPMATVQSGPVFEITGGDTFLIVVSIGKGDPPTLQLDEGKIRIGGKRIVKSDRTLRIEP